MGNNSSKNDKDIDGINVLYGKKSPQKSSSHEFITREIDFIKSKNGSIIPFDKISYPSKSYTSSETKSELKSESKSESKSDLGSESNFQVLEFWICGTDIDDTIKEKKIHVKPSHSKKICPDGCYCHKQIIREGLSEDLARVFGDITHMVDSKRSILNSFILNNQTHSQKLELNPNLNPNLNSDLTSDAGSINPNMKLSPTSPDFWKGRIEGHKRRQNAIISDTTSDAHNINFENPVSATSNAHLETIIRRGEQMKNQAEDSLKGLVDSTSPKESFYKLGKKSQQGGKKKYYSTDSDSDSSSENSSDSDSNSIDIGSLGFSSEGTRKHRRGSDHKHKNKNPRHKNLTESEEGLVLSNSEITTSDLYRLQSKIFGSDNKEEFGSDFGSDFGSESETDSGTESELEGSNTARIGRAIKKSGLERKLFSSESRDILGLTSDTEDYARRKHKANPKYK